MAQTFTPSEAPWGEDDPFLANPYDFYAWGREHSPLRVDTARSGAWGEEVGRINERVAVQFGRGHGVWFVFRHDQCVEISRDHDHWTMEPREGQYDLDPETGERLPRTVGLLNSDPPEHTRLRSLVAEAFTPRTVERLGPRIRAIAEELLDAVPADGRFDLVEAFSHPLPVIVIAEILGCRAATGRNSSSGRTRRSSRSRRGDEGRGGTRWAGGRFRLCGRTSQS